ncbi:hypothetical protein GSI_05869 [Ganoderma sinense ZZ0214-1]|uniref:Uncharacterized protein n=1 Tax=Ganoderma sinense ZZ0214-1 TaxID=1077348 RepID=A0A2G8SBQ4_9APHY|nr:hypothetical protein GSI_05869 [Ganoderma sinense ZZ0214-1]
MSKPYYGPLEDQWNIQLQKSLIASDFVTGVAYGIPLVLWLSCATYLWKNRQKGKNTIFLLSYIALLLVAQTIYSITQVWFTQDIYIENQRYPGGPFKYFFVHQDDTADVIAYVTLCIVILMCDILVLWRCWVVWTALDHRLGYLVVAFPACMILASLVMGTFWIIKSVEPGNTLYSPLPQQLGIAYFSLSLGVNVILTTLIVARLLAFRRANIAFLPPEHAQQYLSTAAVVIESASLYSVFAIVFIVTYGLSAPSNVILLGCAQASQVRLRLLPLPSSLLPPPSSCTVTAGRGQGADATDLAQQVATYLIVYRVAEGKAWSKDTLNEQTVSSANFCGGANAHVHSTTPRFINIEVEMESTVDTERLPHNNR